MKSFKVLSLDGGGMRGLYTSAVLNTLSVEMTKRRNGGNQEKELDIGSGFDLIVGCSTGGIIASALAHGISIKKILELYQNEGSKIFTDPIPIPTKLTKIKFLSWLIRNRNKPTSNDKHLRKLLSNWFGTETLLSLYKRRNIALCIPSVKLENEKSRVFKTPHNNLKQLDNNLTLIDVCMATSAAPYFFPLTSIRSPNEPSTNEVYADGGLWANNPILIGLIEALSLTDKTTPIEILSIGTCSVPEGNIIHDNQLNRGIMDWQIGIKTLTLSMNAQSSSANYSTELLSQILRNYGKNIEILRIKESPPSSEQAQNLRLDLSNKSAIQTLLSLGTIDGLEALRLTQDSSNTEGQMITRIFNSMEYLS